MPERFSFAAAESVLITSKYMEKPLPAAIGSYAMMRFPGKGAAANSKMLPLLVTAKASALPTVSQSAGLMRPLDRSSVSATAVRLVAAPAFCAG